MQEPEVLANMGSFYNEASVISSKHPKTIQNDPIKSYINCSRIIDALSTNELQQALPDQSSVMARVKLVRNRCAVINSSTDQDGLYHLPSNACLTETPEILQSSAFSMLERVLCCLRPVFQRYKNQEVSVNPEPWEVSFECITDLEWLGSGAQGVVFRGRFRGETIAIKKVNRLADTDIRHLRKLRHPNVIQFRGVCLDARCFCVLMEYCPRGQLYKLLHSDTHKPTATVVHNWATQIALGMQYLHGNKIIHRDLKSPKSYGVILWELLTGAIPYNYLDSLAVLWGVGSGKLHLHIPTTCPTELRIIMKMCWNPKPRCRPTFEQIVSHLDTVFQELRQCTDFTSIQMVWKEEIALQLQDIHLQGKGQARPEVQLLRRRREELQHAQDIRKHYEKKLDRVDDLCSELEHLMSDLEVRYQEVARERDNLAKLSNGTTILLAANPIQLENNEAHLQRCNQVTSSSATKTAISGSVSAGVLSSHDSGTATTTPGATSIPPMSYLSLLSKSSSSATNHETNPANIQQCPLCGTLCRPSRYGRAESITTQLADLSQTIAIRGRGASTKMNTRLSPPHRFVSVEALGPSHPPPPTYDTVLASAWTRLKPNRGHSLVPVDKVSHIMGNVNWHAPASSDSTSSDLPSSGIGPSITAETPSSSTPGFLPSTRCTVSNTPPHNYVVELNGRTICSMAPEAVTHLKIATSMTNRTERQMSRDSLFIGPDATKPSPSTQDGNPFGHPSASGSLGSLSDIRSTDSEGGFGIEADDTNCTQMSQSITSGHSRSTIIHCSVPSPSGAINSVIGHSSLQCSGRTDDTEGDSDSEVDDNNRDSSDSSIPREVSLDDSDDSPVPDQREYPLLGKVADMIHQEKKAKHPSRSSSLCENLKNCVESPPLPNKFLPRPVLCTGEPATTTGTRPDTLSIRTPHSVCQTTITSTINPIVVLRAQPGRRIKRTELVHTPKYPSSSTSITRPELLLFRRSSECLPAGQRRGSYPFSGSSSSPSSASVDTHTHMSTEDLAFELQAYMLDSLSDREHHVRCFRHRLQGQNSNSNALASVVNHGRPPPRIVLSAVELPDSPATGPLAPRSGRSMHPVRRSFDPSVRSVRANATRSLMLATTGGSSSTGTTTGMISGIWEADTDLSEFSNDLPRDLTDVRQSVSIGWDNQQTTVNGLLGEPQMKPLSVSTGHSTATHGDSLHSPLAQTVSDDEDKDFTCYRNAIRRRSTN